MLRSNSKEFHRSLKPLLYIAKICGMAPTVMDEINGDFIIRKSTPGLVHSVIYIIIYSALVYFMRKNHIVELKFEGVLLVLDQIRLYLFNVLFYVLIVSALIKQEEFYKIIQSISELDTLFFTLREVIDYKKEFKKNLIYVGLLCVIFAILGIVEFMEYYRPSIEYIAHILMWFPAMFFLHVTLLEFIILVLFMKLRCLKLNNAISKMQTSFNYEPIFNVFPNPRVEYRVIRIKSRSLLIKNTIWNLTVIYDSICEICKSINRVFSLSITFGLGTITVYLTSMIYDFACHIKNDMKGSVRYKWEHYVISTLSVALHIVLIFCITYSCNGAKTEADQVAVLLHRLNPKRIEDREAINTFSLLSMHQKVRFTASGLFDLDYTFIYLVRSRSMSHSLMQLMLTSHFTVNLNHNNTYGDSCTICVIKHSLDLLQPKPDIMKDGSTQKRRS